MRYDVLVVGGGVVGLATAAALCRAGFRICVVDAGAPDVANADVGGYELRVSTLTRGAEHVLTHLGAWALLPHARIQPFFDMRVWDEGSPGELHFSAADVGEPHLGVLAENSRVAEALEAVLREVYPGQCDWRRPAKLESLHADVDGVVARVSGEPMEAELIVGADGASSFVRQLMQLDTHVREYDQNAVVANLRLELSHEETAWQRFLSTGPIAMLPLPGDYGSIVWSTTPDEAAALVTMDTDAFQMRVAEALDGRFGRMVWCSKRVQFPLRRVQAREYVATRTVLVGDAAHAIHPLAGQGLNLGIMDAATLSAVLVEAREAGRSFSGRSTLRRYERWRKAQNVATQNAMDALGWVFGRTARPLRELRGLGVNLVQANTPLRRKLCKLASGVSGDLPPLARATL